MTTSRTPVEGSRLFRGRRLMALASRQVTTWAF